MKNKTGFTLVELMISMSIIAILSVILVVSFSNVQKNGRDQRRIADLKAIQSAAEQYLLLKGSYPANKTTPWTINSQVVLQTFPTGPKGVGDTYAYVVSSSGYCACSNKMESGKYGNADQIQVPCDFQSVGTNYCVGNQQ
jgi:prepilin-type N-terminal cleavage/methylation domain-containing protein